MDAEPVEFIEFSLQVQTTVLGLWKYLKTVSFSLISYSTAIQSALLLGIEAGR